MANIVRLKVAGFKSFVDPVEVAIPPGLTGIVGPNGCGKSNVVEALRWAMGETSAKQLRGAGMDDVIFAGAAGRPSRNVAEVAISLSDRDGNFPVPWIGQAELEVTRKIERGGGSSYRVNGRETRARDVQTLFADLASGARSAAIVSQGQIGAFVVAKPEQRRAILEEAAGVAGLRARRHEATLRLNAAETNLERLEDVLLGFDNQLSGLEKQARQANRFRKLSDLIRAAEAAAFLARWRLAEGARAEADGAARAAEAAVADAVRAAAAAERLAIEATSALPAARKAEAEASAGQQRLRLELERIDAKSSRRADAKAAARQRLDDVARDIEREQARAAASGAALDRLMAEAQSLAEAARSLDDPVGLDARIAEVAATVTERIQTANAAADKVANIEATARAAIQRQMDARVRMERASAAAAAATRALESAQAGAPAEAGVTEAVQRAELAKQALLKAQAATEQAREAAETARGMAEKAREARAEVNQTQAALAAESKTLTGLLARSGTDKHSPALDQVRAQNGFETALGAALGDDLEAALDPAAAAYWSGRTGSIPDSALPAGATPLLDYIAAPAVLALRLSQIGVVETAADGERLATALAMGQRLVSKAGDLWRWDGFCQRAGAETTAARKLALQNRLSEVDVALAAAQQNAAKAGEAAAMAQSAAQSAEAQDKQARGLIRQARQAAEQRAADAVRIERALAAHKAGIAAKAEAASLATEQAKEAIATKAEADAAAATIADSAAARTIAEDQRAEANAAQLGLAELRSERQRLASAQAQNVQRRQAVDQEQRQWREASTGAAEGIKALQARAVEAEAQIAAADQGDAGEDESRARILDALEVAEAQRRTLADALIQAETQANERANVTKAAEAAASAARETRVGAQAEAVQAKNMVDVLRDRIAERLDATPGDLAEIASVDTDTVSSDLDTLDRRVERLRRERENMGAVNLRADTEIEDIQTQS
ncbi:MAG: AAA family ATPase, partial [Alphaproteobacteria bacterium]